jgi:hypothetical protein
MLAACFIMDLLNRGGAEKIGKLGVPVRTLVSFEEHCEWHFDCRIVRRGAKLRKEIAAPSFSWASKSGSICRCLSRALRDPGYEP